MGLLHALFLKATMLIETSHGELIGAVTLNAHKERHGFVLCLKRGSLQMQKEVHLSFLKCICVGHQMKGVNATAGNSEMWPSFYLVSLSLKFRNFHRPSAAIFCGMYTYFKYNEPTHSSKQQHEYVRLLFGFRKYESFIEWKCWPFFLFTSILF